VNELASSHDTASAITNADHGISVANISTFATQLSAFSVFEKLHPENSAYF